MGTAPRPERPKRMDPHASLARVGELARSNAVETVGVLRQWLHEQPK